MTDEDSAAGRVAELEDAAHDLHEAAKDARRLLERGRPGEAADRLARTRNFSIEGRVDDAVAALRECIR